MSVLLPEAAPANIFHYTSMVGLIGILDSKTLWATDIEFMNDAQEGRYGRAEARAALLEMADRIESKNDAGPGGAEASRVTILRSASDHLEPGGPFARRQYFFVFACCFCEEK